MEREDIHKEIFKFIKERNWEQFHTPKNLAISVGAEVGELLECFQWKTDEQIKRMIEEKNTEEIADEIADVYTYLVSLSKSLDIDLYEAVTKKIEKNKEKYPVEKSFGIAKKYNEL